MAVFAQNSCSQGTMNKLLLWWQVDLHIADLLPLPPSASKGFQFKRTSLPASLMTLHCFMWDLVQSPQISYDAEPVC